MAAPRSPRFASPPSPVPLSGFDVALLFFFLGSPFTMTAFFILKWRGGSVPLVSFIMRCSSMIFPAAAIRSRVCSSGLCMICFKIISAERVAFEIRFVRSDTIASRVDGSTSVSSLFSPMDRGRGCVALSVIFFFFFCFLGVVRLLVHYIIRPILSIVKPWEIKKAALWRPFPCGLFGVSFQPTDCGE